MVESNCIVKFYADWCGPCKQLAPVVERLTKELGVTLVSVNIDENPELAQQFGVRSIPAVFAIKDGAPVGSCLGNKSESDLRALFEKVVA
jgi:thioredoxin